MSRRGKGPVGTSMGSSFRTSFKKSLPHLIRAQDILVLASRGEPDISPELLDVCRRTVEHMFDATSQERNLIHKHWMMFAESGKLRGVRGWREEKPVAPQGTPSQKQMTH